MSKFDWNKLAKNLNENALTGGKKTYENDDRFYILGKDDAGNGGALIRFLSDKDDVPFVNMTKINAQQGKGQPFISEWSPQSIGAPDPVNERFSELWKAGKKEEAKKYGRKFRFLTNIKVLKDPANPENEGKIFLLDMSPTLFEKIKNAAAPSESELALGGEAKEVFDPVNGNSFLLKVKLGSTNIPSYEDSKFADKIDGIYKTEAAATADILENSYALSEFLDPKNFLTYEELQKKLDWFDGVTAETEVPTVAKDPVETPTADEVDDIVEEIAPKAKPAPKVKTEAPEISDTDVDDLLDDLLN